ncbi:MAG: ABC transporter permease [Alphaproteobacteria bacterium]|nr:ABC transporter permease [Alphaproteobacteria bacterium]
MSETLQRLVGQLRAVVVKEIRQTTQDRRMIFLLTVAPFLQLLLFGFAIDLDVDQVPTAVVDLDHTPESRETIAGMLADGTLAHVATPPSVPDAERLLEDGTVAVVLVLPEGYGRDLARGVPTQAQVLVDGTDPTRANVAGGAASGYLGLEGLRLAQAQIAARLPEGRTLPSVVVRPRLFYNPTQSTPIYMVPGIAGMLLLIITTIVVSMGLAREREMGTLEAVRVTPLPTPVLMVGKIAPFVVVGLFDVTLAITAGAWIFDVPIRGSLLLFYGITALYLLTTVGVGLFVSTVSQTQQQAFLGGFIFVLPAMLLSGTMTPIHAMPAWMQPLTALNPLRFYMEAVRAILLKGATFTEVRVQAAALLVYGLAIMALATSRFRKRVS